MPVKIAIIDDHEVFRKALALVLEKWGYAVEWQAPNGKRFLEQLAEGRIPDICILDVIMPEMNGYDTIKWLRLKWPDIKICMYSMRIDMGMNGIPLFGSDATVSKSSDLSELEAALKKLGRDMIACKAG